MPCVVKLMEFYPEPDDRDKKIIGDVEKWATYPSLPLKRRSGELATLYYLDERQEYFIARSRDKRPVWFATTVAEVIGDGWRVDQ